MTQFPNGYLKGERQIVWLEDLSRFRFVRESLHKDMPPNKPPSQKAFCSRQSRIVGYAILDPDQRDSEKSRRLFIVRNDDSRYRTPGCPWEGVDPLTVSPGVPGQQNERANGGPFPMVNSLA
jgi:hypothetical protein